MDRNSEDILAIIGLSRCESCISSKELKRKQPLARSTLNLRWDLEGIVYSGVVPRYDDHRSSGWKRV